MDKWDKICGILEEQHGLSGLLQLRSMYQASLPYWYFQIVWPMEQTREMASRQPNSTRIWKLVIRSTLDSFRGGRVEFWVTRDETDVVKNTMDDDDVLFRDEYDSSTSPSLTSSWNTSPSKIFLLMYMFTLHYRCHVYKVKCFKKDKGASVADVYKAS